MIVLNDFFSFRSKDLEANEKRREHERLMAESIALEGVKDEIRRKEEEKSKKKQNGYPRYKTDSLKLTLLEISCLIVVYKGISSKAALSEIATAFQGSHC